MAQRAAAGNVDYRLLERHSNLVICSRCLSEGRLTPVPQVLSPRHTPRSMCQHCAKPRRQNLRRVLTRLADR